jgi:hypothetical protein
MVREPHHDKNVFIKSKFKNHKSKIFLGFPNVPFNAVVFGGLNENRAEASTNGAKFQFDSFGEDLTPNPSPKERGERTTPC